MWKALVTTIASHQKKMVWTTHSWNHSVCHTNMPNSLFERRPC